ncbi:MAG: hypothetical protein R3F49_04165 [Planctomycetota bacterium]
MKHKTSSPSLCAVVALTLVACGGGRGALHSGTAREHGSLGAGDHPRPSDPREAAEGDEGERDLERQRYIEALHKAAPGVDWRAIEAANHERERQRRVDAVRNMGAGAALRTGFVWEEVGSRNLAGHTRTAHLGPDLGAGRALYLGSANGGVWRSDPTGGSWAPMSDDVFGGADDVLALAPPTGAEPVVVFRKGTNVYRSDDGGATWDLAGGLGAVAEGRRLILLADAGQTLLLAARGPSGGGTKLGVWASSDQGRTFQRRKSFATDFPGDIWAPRVGAGAGTDLFALERGRLWRSTDAGVNWTALAATSTTATEGVLTGSEAGAPHLYVGLRETGWELFRSTDAGASLQARGALVGYWNGTRTLVAFPDDPNRLLHGGVECKRSSNGGSTWTLVNSWGSYYGNPAQRLHADIRHIDVQPDPAHPPNPPTSAGGHLAYIHTDGGTYVSTDFGQSVQNLCLDGLGVGQFYGTLTSTADPDLIVGGTQDQGYQRGARLPSTGPGPSTPFTQLTSGDYAHLVSPDGTHRRVYSVYPGFVLVQRGEANPALSQASFPAFGSALWLPPLAAEATDTEAFYILGETLWRCRWNGSSWTATQRSTQSFSEGPANYGSALAFAPSAPLRGYAANDDGTLFRTLNGGVTWTAATQTGPDPHYVHGQSFAIDPANPDLVAVGGSGYSTPGVRLSTDGGVTWSAHHTGLPSTLVYDLAWAGDGSGDLYAATEAGAWVRRAGAAAWESAMGLDAPSTTYWSVEAVPGGERMRFGTYGRGIWDLSLTPKQLGVRYCSPATPNAVGVPGELTATGSDVASDNAFVLNASALPAGTFGFFFTGDARASVTQPGGSQGVLCVGGGIGRYVAPGQVQQANAAGEFSLAVDLTQHPRPIGVVSVQAGETWTFQAWYRDTYIVFPTSNFTDALEVTFR